MLKNQEYSYLNEEELTLLIRQTEEEMLQAPGYLKERILNQAVIEESRDKGTDLYKKPFLLYSAKVVIAMAAALLILFLTPADTTMFQKTIAVKSGSMKKMTRQFNQKTSYMVSLLNKYSFQPYNKEDYFNDKKEE